MTNQYIFHVRNAPPGDLAAVLAVLESYPELSTISDVVVQAENMGFVIQDHQRLEALITARDLGLVLLDRNILTDKGKVLTQLERYKSDLFVDIVHGLLYTLWSSKQEGENCISWSYRTLCNMLWKLGDGKLSSNRGLASDIEAQVRTVFSRPDISFSSKSILDSLLWLSELNPPVLYEGKRFSCRTFCQPELLVIAIDFVYRTLEIDYGVNLLLSDKNRDVICQVCLLETESFDRVLEYAVAQFKYLHKGIGGGWGQYLILDKAPGLEDFI